MTKEELIIEYNRRIETMKSGKPIQFKNRKTMNNFNNCISGNCPLWDWDNFDYRIKPEPRVCYVSTLNDGELGNYLWFSPDQCTGKAIKFVEVLDD